MFAECYVNKEGPEVLRILTDSSQPTQERVKAAEMIGDIGELETIEPIWNLKFGALIHRQRHSHIVMRVTNHRWLRKPKSKEESVDEKVFV